MMARAILWHGYYTTQEIADDPQLRDVPILMVSSIADTPYVSSFPTDQYLQHYSEFCLHGSPIEPASLLSKIKELLRVAETRGLLFKRIHDRAFEEYAQMPWGG